MNLHAPCGSCNGSCCWAAGSASDGFQCPFCAFALATVAPAVGGRFMVAQAALVTALAQLESMTGDHDAALDAAATARARSARQAEDTLGGPGLVPGGASFASEPGS
jgi:hypothetical protein